MAEVLHRLEVESLDLGPDVRAVLLELIEPETREPVKGREAARVWAAIVPALAAGEKWALDFFAHLDRVRDFCSRHGIAFRESDVLVVPRLPAGSLVAIFERFAGETFGVRAGSPLASGDATLEGALAERGLDAYREAFPRYLFCAVCDFENGFLTVLSEHLWASEIIRRARASLDGLPVAVARPV